MRRRSRRRRGIAAYGGGLLLLIASTLSAGETAPEAALIPPVVVAPLPDGKAEDLAWKAAEARLPPFETTSPPLRNLRAFAVCDEEQLYLLLRGLPPEADLRKKDARWRVTLEFGPGPWLDRCLWVDEGRLLDGVWTGWGWHAPIFTGARAAANATESEGLVEFAVPRAACGPPALEKGARVSFRLSVEAPGEEEGEAPRASLVYTGRLERPRSSRPDPVVTERPPAVVTPAAGLNHLGHVLETASPPEGVRLEVEKAVMALLRGQKGEAGELLARVLRAWPRGSGGDVVDDPWEAALPDAPRRIGKLSTPLAFDHPHHWTQLAEQARTDPAWRDVALASLRLDMLPALETAGEIGRIETILEAWNRYVATVPYMRGGRLHPAWRPDLAAVRARRFAELAAGRLSHGPRNAGLVDCLVACRRAYERALYVLLADGGMSPWPSETVGHLAACVKALPLVFPDDRERPRMRQAAGFQFLARLLPGGAGRLPGGGELLALQTWLALGPPDQGLRPPPPPSLLAWSQERMQRIAGERGGDAAVALDSLVLRRAESSLEYLAHRVLPEGRLPGASLRPEEFDEPALARWGKALFPGREILGRFTPEGTVALPLNGSRPRKTTSKERGGLYVMRAAAGRVACAVYGSGVAVGGDPEAARSLYGAITLAMGPDRLVLEPDAGALPTFQSVRFLGDEHGAEQGRPLATSLPRSGPPLPHGWLTCALFDSLRLEWQARVGGRAMPAYRRILFLKEGAAGPCVYVHDGARPKAAEAARLKTIRQVLPLPSDAAKRLRVGLLHRQRLKREPGRIEIEADALRPASAFLLVPGLPERGEAGLKDIRIQREGAVGPAGGGVVLIKGEGDAVDLVLDNPGAAPLEGRFGQTEVLFDGDLAWVQPTKGLPRRAGWIGTRRLEIGIGSRVWRLRFSARTGGWIRLREDGSYNIRLETAEKPAVEVDLVVEEEGADDRSAAIQLLVGHTLVFRPI